MAILSTVRAELVLRARDKNRRTNAFRSEEPCDWRPRQMAHPQTGLPFTDVGAWNFIAELLESGCDVAEIVMQKPRGKTGYEILVAGPVGCPEIYIKLTLSSNMVHGRSFHYSER
jgi:hypothetical protein